MLHIKLQHNCYELTQSVMWVVKDTNEKLGALHRGKERCACRLPAYIQSSSVVRMPLPALQDWSPGCMPPRHQRCCPNDSHHHLKSADREQRVFRACVCDLSAWQSLCEQRLQLVYLLCVNEYLRWSCDTDNVRKPA